MSQHNKLSLWQKIKRLLTASAPRPVTDATSTQTHLSSADHNIDNSTHKKTESADSSSQVTDSVTLVDNSALGSDPALGSNATLKKDNANTAPQNHRETPIVDCLKQYFDNKQWHYTHYRPKTNDSQQSHHLSLRMRHKQVNCGYLFRIQEKNKLLAIYGILPFLIPESHQNAALLLITQINYDMLIGNLEMDINDGEVRYKNAIDVEAVGIDHDIIEHLLQSVVAMTTVANELFGDLINNRDPAEDISTLLAELRQQSDARTFFLPTQFVQ